MSQGRIQGVNRTSRYGLVSRRAVAWVLTGLLLVSCAPTTKGATPSPSLTTGAPGTSSAEPTPSSAQSGATDSKESGTATVYFIIDTAAGPRLARELRKVRGDALEAAVQTMIDGPLDPDYTTLWNPDTTVLSVSSGSGVVTVDLSDSVRDSQVGPEAARLMIQQLVFTATTWDPTAKVRLLIDGKNAGQLWNGVTWDQAIGRAEPTEVLSPLQLDKPVQGAQLTTDNTSFSGEVLAGSVIIWRVDHAAGEEGVAGELPVPAGSGFVPFSFAHDLGPGKYILELSVHPADDPGGIPLVVDTRSFSVHLAA